MAGGAARGGGGSGKNAGRGGSQAVRDARAATRAGTPNIRDRERDRGISDRRTDTNGRIPKADDRAARKESGPRVIRIGIVAGAGG
jgi:hypothetical protein